MKSLTLIFYAFFLNCVFPAQEGGKKPEVPANHVYSWKSNTAAENKLVNRIPAPAGYERTPLAKASFGDWLRNIPLKPGKPAVLLYNGEKKERQDLHVAVVDIDVGNKNLQQCADAVMRLRAEYLYAAKRFDDIHFNFTSGSTADYNKWRNGFRPSVNGNDVEWKKTTAADASYQSFRDYLNTVFTYCGTSSLSKEMKSVKNVHNLQAGDVFIKGGFPGHAVLIMDVAQNSAGDKVFLLAQSYMPAQDIHILVNPNSKELSPWYSEKFFDILNTPEWTFYKEDLMTW